MIGALFGVSAELVEINAVRASMVEHPVENNAYTFRRGFLAQFGKGLFVAEQFVYFEIVRRIVTVVAGRGKNGRKIDDGYSQSRKIIQFGNYPLRVAAVKVVGTVILTFNRDVGNFVPIGM